MSTTYKVLIGDTLDKISKKIFGSEIHAQHVSQANPGLSVLTPGIDIVVPALPDYPGDLPKILGIDGTLEIQIFIEGSRYEFWESISITKGIDSIDTITFTAPFDADAPGFRDTFQPFTYKSLLVFVDGDLYISGTIIAIVPVVSVSSVNIKVSAYSLPGVLQNCTMPSSAYPLEFASFKLDAIARAVAKPFGLSVDFESDPGDVFDPAIAIEPTEKVHDFLAKLARKRNLVITSTDKGRLKFWQSYDSGVPVSELREGEAPLMAVIPNLNEQEYYSHVTGISFVATGVEGSQFTDKNPFLPGKVRPFTFGASDTDQANIKTTVNAKIGRMFANVASYKVTVSTWRDKSGKLWSPNTTVSLFSPNAIVYRKYNFILRAVTFFRDSNSETATLELILPGSFSGKLPKELPWAL